MDTTACEMRTTVLLHPKYSVKCTACTSNQNQHKQIESWVIKPLCVALDDNVVSRTSRERANTKWIRQHTKYQQQSCCTQIVASNVPLALAIKSKTSRFDCWVIKPLVVVLNSTVAGRIFLGMRQHKIDTTAYKMPTTVLLQPQCSVKCTACTSNQKQDK